MTDRFNLEKDWSAKQKTGFHMKCNTGLKGVKQIIKIKIRI